MKVTSPELSIFAENLHIKHVTGLRAADQNYQHGNFKFLAVRVAALSVLHRSQGWLCVRSSDAEAARWFYFRDQLRVSHRTTQCAWETAVRRYRYVSRLCCRDETWKGQRSELHTDLVSDGSKSPHITMMFLYILELIHHPRWKSFHRRRWRKRPRSSKQCYVTQIQI